MKNTISSTKPASNTVMPTTNDDTLNIYLRSISKTPALSAEQEREFAKTAKEGSNEEALAAKKELVRANLKLVVNIVRKTVQVTSLPMVDLIQEGNLGLMIAVEKFDYKLGYRFSTYAAWWIKQSVFKAISEQSYCIKIPVYIQETLSKFSKVKAELEQKYNASVKNEVVAREMNIEPEKIDRFLGAYNKSLSIDAPYELSSGSEVTLSDVLEDEKADVFSALESDALKHDLEFVISQLKEREQAVVRMRYGFGEWSRKTLEEIGKIYGVTKECIRQTENRALRKLREMSFTGESLAAYIS